MKPRFSRLQKISGGRYLLCLFLLSLALPGFSPKTCLAASESIFKKTKSSVVVVYTYARDGSQIAQASGFIAGRDGVVVTNYHIISNAARIKIKFKDKMLEVKGVLYIDRDNDIAMLKIGGHNLPAVKIREADIGPAGQKVYLLGSPGGEGKIILEGTLSRIKYVTSEKKLLLITTPVAKGSSGGPVLNEKGEVIGVATFFVDETQPFYFAMPVSRIKSRLSLKRITPLAKAKLMAPEDTAEYWSNLAEAYESLGLFPEASGAYQNAIKIRPKDAIAHNKLALVYANLDIYSYAIREHNEAISLKPDYQEAYYNLGIAYLKSGKIQKAAETLEIAIRLKPDDAKSYNNLAVAFFKSDKLKEAIGATKQAIKIRPDYAEAYYNMGAVYTQMSMYAEAIEALKQFIRLKPDIPEGHLRLGIIYSMQDTASALKEYELLKNMDPESAKLLANIIQAKKDSSSVAGVSSGDVAKEKIPQQEAVGISKKRTLSTAVSARPEKEVLPSQTTDASEMATSSEELDSPEHNSRPVATGKSGRSSKKDIYSVQLSVFNNKKNALSLSKRLKKKGYATFIITERKGKRTLRYRVLVGRFSDKTKALKTSRDVFRKEKLKSIIFRH